jgi:hypothetical protein
MLSFARPKNQQEEQHQSSDNTQKTISYSTLYQQLFLFSICLPSFSSPFPLDFETQEPSMPAFEEAALLKVGPDVGLLKAYE